MTAQVPRSGRDLRADIIFHATRLFAEKGFSATSVRELVEACQCTKPSLYYYFDSKETLFEQVVQLHMDTANAVLDTLADGPGGTRANIHRAVGEWADWAEANPDAMQLLQRIETQPEEGAPQISCAAAREMHLQMMSSLIERGIETGELRGNIDPFEVALVVGGTLSFQFEMALAERRFDRGQLKRTIDMIFDGIAA